MHGSIFWLATTVNKQLSVALILMTYPTLRDIVNAKNILLGEGGIGSI
jgi:hypothetical protein